MKRKLTVGYSTIVVVLVIMSLLCLYPLWYTLVSSFSSKQYITSGKAWIWPLGFHLESYKEILKDSLFLKAFGTSVKRVVVGCSVNIVLLVMTAFPLSLPRKKFPAGKYIMWFFVINMYISGGMIPGYMLMRQYGLFDSFWALILPTAFPLGNLIIMINYFRTLPFELYEAAIVDGANPPFILLRIFVPLCKPSIATMLLFFFVNHWNAYFDGLLYISKMDQQPLQTYIYQLSVKVDYATMTGEQIINALKLSNQSFDSAKVFVALIPILLVYPFLQKHFTKGMLLGAVKG